MIVPEDQLLPYRYHPEVVCQQPQQPTAGEQIATDVISAVIKKLLGL
jgi:hypothetical protein